MESQTKLSPDRAPIVDQYLADLFKNASNPIEPLKDNQQMAFFIEAISGSRRNIATSPRLVELECGHYHTTKATTRCGCPRCGAMQRAGYDYDKFRHIDHIDDFEWPADPLRKLNEKNRD